MIDRLRRAGDGMSFARRVAFLTGGAVAIAVVIAASATYVLARGQLISQLDDSLAERGRVGAAVYERSPLGGVSGDRIGGRPDRPGPPGPPRPQDLGELEEADGLRGPAFAVQVIDSTGEIRFNPPGDGDTLPPSDRAREVAAGDSKPLFETVEVGGDPVRVLTLPLEDGLALQVARSSAEVEDTLSKLLLLLGMVILGGIGLAALLGSTVARTAIAPLSRLSRTAEEVAETGDLSRRIDPGAGPADELSGLAHSFNAMLAALEASVGAQKQLVADASHELRTPLTSLRTNIETLQRSPELPTEDRERIEADLVAELEELTRLVGDVVDLAREGAAAEDPFRPVRLDELVASAADRAQRRTDTVRIETNLQAAVLEGSPERLDRAVSNLIDNAVKWSSGGGPVEVALAGRSLVVRDHGPGIDPADLPHVFDRFYRADAARGLPGSGLGLAIVKQVADEHGAEVLAGNAEGGGAVMEIRFPDLLEEPEF